MNTDTRTARDFVLPRLENVEAGEGCRRAPKKEYRPRTKAAAKSPKIPEGQRNAELASLAGSMRRRGSTEAAIVAALLVENRQRCNPPLAEREVRAIAASVANYEPAPAPRAHTPKYDAHLLTPKWRELRRLVFARANDCCEGCGLRQPEVCHHKTYAHLGDEFLFELLALCQDCSDRFHRIGFYDDD